jgi:hypothetical protein
MPTRRGAIPALLYLFSATLEDPTVIYIVIVGVGHVLIDFFARTLGHRIDVLDVGIGLVDASVLLQLVVRVNLGTIYMIGRALGVTSTEKR